MDYITGINRGIDYLENHLNGEIDLEAAAKEAAMSVSYFQKIFGILFGITLGEYIRLRRLSLAGRDLARTREKVIDVAAKYGYETPESFTRAFTKFHGISPSAARNEAEKLSYFSPLSIRITLQGGKTMNYSIKTLNEIHLMGYKTRFIGAPYGNARATQEENLLVTTRAKQWLLRGAADACTDGNTEICVLTDQNADGYTFWYTTQVEGYNRDNFYNPKVTGIDFMRSFGFEELTIPRNTYAVFSTDKQAYPVERYIALREAIANEILASEDLKIADGPELAIYHWSPVQSRAQRYIEIYIPIMQR